MGEEGKKISFGFSKLMKKTSIISNKNNQVKKANDDGIKVELIDCFEEKAIKLKDPVVVEDKVLVIPLKSQDNEKKQELSSLVKKSSLPSSEKSPGPVSLHEPCDTDTQQTTQPTLDDLAAREILEDLKTSKSHEEKRIFSVPLTSDPPEGQKESTLEDYDNIPIEDFGMAMLRGMGWAPGKGIGKNETLSAPTPSAPTLRPKGMGLGADKVIKTSVKSNNNEDLKMVKGSFVRIIAGPNKDSYGQIEGFDDESGRLIVKLALKGSTVSLNEFMIQLVSKTEYTNNSKVMNVAKYEEYKAREGKDSETVQEISRKSQKIALKPSDHIVSTSKNRHSQHNSSSESESSDRRSKSIKTIKSSKKNTFERKRSNSRDRSKKSQLYSSDSDDHKYQAKYDTKSKNERYSKNERSKRSSSQEDYETRRRSRSSSRLKSSTSNSVKYQSKPEKKYSSHTRRYSASSDSSEEYVESHKKVHLKKKKKNRSRSRSRSPKRHRSHHKKHKSSKY